MLQGPSARVAAWNGSCMKEINLRAISGSLICAAKGRDLAETRNGLDPPSRGTSSPNAQRDSKLKIAIVDESPVRAAILEDGLREAGFTQVERISKHAIFWRASMRSIRRDSDRSRKSSRDVLEQMFQMSRAVTRPVAMFVDQSDSASIQAAVDAGVSAYIVDGLKRSESPASSICVSRASTRFPGCRVSLTTQKMRLKNERSLIAPKVC